MSITLSYGYKKPENGDKGDVFFPDLEFDIQRLNDHTHNGVNSANIPTTSISSVKQPLPSANWLLESAGKWYQELTLPNDANYSDVFIMVKNSAGDQMFLDIKAGTSSKKYKVYSNDNNLTATAYVLV
jgi:hypothetical protein